MEPRTLQLMELQTQQQIEDGGNNQAAGSSANIDFWRSRARWVPTPDQIRILKDLYYDKGVKCPTTEHIHEICLQLNQYGHVEGKNIYFWFQNVRAREKQMKRCNQAAQVPMGTSSPGTGGSIDLNFGSTGSTGAGGSIDINFGPAGGSIDINFGSTSSTDDGRSINLNFGSTDSTGNEGFLDLNFVSYSSSHFNTNTSTTLLAQQEDKHPCNNEEEITRRLKPFHYSPCMVRTSWAS
ncbi:WUSCHEL-related homeobox 1-like [Rosa rugosa]|uniref:WUSCHEL-related homeobox 1-like n=1 Tax=Rosa rugosa TaxID=74645 RepID=UPI002B409F68|nr:WUSCHEL-related homeobox 1-like [Rosa rugosa]